MHGLARWESRYDDATLVMNIDKDNVADYLYTRHLLDAPPEGSCTVEELGGGFLNTVLRVSAGDRSVVVKQALDALRLFPDLRVTTDRIVYETQALRELDGLFPEGTVPAVLHFDDERRILVMSDLGKRPSLETELERGRVDASVAGKLGEFLSSLHCQTWDDPDLRARFDNEDMQGLRYKYCFYFVEDPDLNRVARRLAETFTETKQALLHGDFWTASVIVAEERVHTFDLEFVNYGHPAQDAGFIMAHYLLHAYNSPRNADRVFDAVERLWATYADGMGDYLAEGTETTALRQAGLEMMFRIDGINQVKYITDDGIKARIRQAARPMMLDEGIAVAGLRHV